MTTAPISATVVRIYESNGYGYRKSADGYELLREALGADGGWKRVEFYTSKAKCVAAAKRHRAATMAEFESMLSRRR